MSKPRRREKKLEIEKQEPASLYCELQMTSTGVRIECNRLPSHAELRELRGGLDGLLADAEQPARPLGDVTTAEAGAKPEAEQDEDGTEESAPRE
jgi:hypothetical protein